MLICNGCLSLLDVCKDESYQLVLSELEDLRSEAGGKRSRVESGLAAPARPSEPDASLLSREKI